MKDFNLKISEIKKAERFAAKESGKTCFLAAMSYSGADVFGWQDVSARWTAPRAASMSAPFIFAFT